jgi:hypothetical protein
VSDSIKKSITKEFHEWAENLKHRVDPKFKVEIGMDENIPNQGAWINLIGNDQIGIMTVWNTGEYEHYFQNILSGENHSYFYGNDITPVQFEQFFSSIIREYT